MTDKKEFKQGDIVSFKYYSNDETRTGVVLIPNEIGDALVLIDSEHEVAVGIGDTIYTPREDAAYSERPHLHAQWVPLAELTLVTGLDDLPKLVQSAMRVGGDVAEDLYDEMAKAWGVSRDDAKKYIVGISHAALGPKLDDPDMPGINLERCNAIARVVGERYDNYRDRETLASMGKTIYTDTNDEDTFVNGELAEAAAAFALAASNYDEAADMAKAHLPSNIKQNVPWHRISKRQALAVAGSFILAELERLERKDAATLKEFRADLDRDVREILGLKASPADVMQQESRMYRPLDAQREVNLFPDNDPGDMQYSKSGDEIVSDIRRALKTMGAEYDDSLPGNGGTMTLDDDENHFDGETAEGAAAAAAKLAGRKIDVIDVVISPETDGPRVNLLSHPVQGMDYARIQKWADDYKAACEQPLYGGQTVIFIGDPPPNSAVKTGMVGRVKAINGAGRMTVQFPGIATVGGASENDFRPFPPPILPTREEKPNLGQPVGVGEFVVGEVVVINDDRGLLADLKRVPPGSVGFVEGALDGSLLVKFPPKGSMNSPAAALHDGGGHGEPGSDRYWFVRPEGVWVAYHPQTEAIYDGD